MEIKMARMMENGVYGCGIEADSFEEAYEMALELYRHGAVVGVSTPKAKPKNDPIEELKAELSGLEDELEEAIAGHYWGMCEEIEDEILKIKILLDELI